MRLPPNQTPKKKKGDPNAMREVVLHLDGEKHDLAIGYLAETPVWRPSYRVVVHADGTADLQAWGIVQNLSGEDWNDVELSLVAGAPLAFQSTLGTPVVPERPTVSDQGEIIAAVPTGVTSLDKGRQSAEVERIAPDEDMATAAPPAEPSPEMAESAVEDGAMDEEAARKVAPRRIRPTAATGVGGGSGRVALGVPGGVANQAAPAPAAPPPPPTPAQRADLSAPRNVMDLAAVAVEAGTTRYDIPKRITVPNESATMVLLTSQRVPGEAVYLFAPDPGVQASSAHPFRVARFTNATAGLLERGPIAVFERGSFLGQGLLDPLPPRATATVPFALERSVAISSDRRYDQQGARLYRIESGQLWIERDEVTRTIYKVDNGSNRPAKLLVKHARIGGTRLFRPPAGTEDNAASGNALVPVPLKPHGKVELTVDERRAHQQLSDWLSPFADDAVKGYLADKRANPDVVRKLKDAWVVRESLKRGVDEQQKLRDEQGELEKLTYETRQNLRAIEKNTQAADLRTKLTKRLGESTQRLEQITKRMIEIEMVVNEQRVRLRDALQDIRLPGPLPPTS